MEDSIFPHALNVLTIPGVKGNGENDDSAGIQRALNRSRIVYLPYTLKGYSVSKTLQLHSGQTLIADPCATIKAADWCRAHLLTNSAEEDWQHDITVIGGIWDGNNLHQSCYYHDTARYDEGYSGDGRKPYDPNEYMGMLFRFSKVKRLTIRQATFKDPEMYAVQIGNIEDFLIENIRFDYNMKKFNMDGIHVHGNSRNGLIRNIHGSTNDDMVALNADDCPVTEMSRGPIEDIVIEGLYAHERCLTGVRMLSCGNPVRRVRVSNVFGSFKCSGIYFSHHNVHPGEASTFEDIAVDGLWFSRCHERMCPPLSDEVEKIYVRDPIWVAPTTRVSSLTLRNLHRHETQADPAPAMINIYPKGRVDFLDVSASHLVTTSGTVGLLRNQGVIGVLSLRGVHVEPSPGGDNFTVWNQGKVLIA